MAKEYVFCIEWHHNLRRDFRSNTVVKKRHIKSVGVDYYTIWLDDGATVNVPKTPQPFDIKNQSWYCHESEKELINNAVTVLETHYEGLYNIDKIQKLQDIEKKIKDLKKEYKKVEKSGVEKDYQYSFRSYFEFLQQIEHIKNVIIKHF